MPGQEALPCRAATGLGKGNALLPYLPARWCLPLWCALAHGVGKCRNCLVLLGTGLGARAADARETAAQLTPGRS
jgi:hypothetical protein